MIHSDLTISTDFWEWPRVFAQTHIIWIQCIQQQFAWMNPLHSSYQYADRKESHVLKHFV